MSFLRRLLGGRSAETKAAETEAADTKAAETEAAEAERAPVDVDEAEVRHERELLAAEEDRLDDLQRRQLRYAEHAWRPPPEGGARRADDADRAGNGSEPEG